MADGILLPGDRRLHERHGSANVGNESRSSPSGDLEADQKGERRRFLHVRLRSRRWIIQGNYVRNVDRACRLFLKEITRP